MDSQNPLVLQLQNGETLTLSPKEISDSDFQTGWQLAARGKGTLNLPRTVKNVGIFKLGNNAYDALASREPLRTTKRAIAIHAMFLRKGSASDKIRMKCEKAKASIERWQTGLNKAKAKLWKLQLECKHEHNHSEADAPDNRVCEDCEKEWKLPPT